MIHLKNVNPTKLVDELVAHGIIPVLVKHDRKEGEHIAENTWITFADDADMDLVQQVIDAHDPSPLPRPETPEQRIAALEDENAFLALELATAQARLDQTEQEQAALLLELVSREVI